MYSLHLTARQYRAATVISLSLWDVDENESRELLAQSTTSIPVVQGGLFQEPASAFADAIVSELFRVSEKWRDTGQ